VTASEFLARWRVRLGYLLGIAILFLARPTPASIVIGAALGLIGLAIRAYAAGYLHKQAVLTTTGPYAYTRNPLYFGSSFLTLGAAVASKSWIAAALLLVYFAVIYSFVMRREELELLQQHGPLFAAYAAAVPLFFPKLSVKATVNTDGQQFSWRQYNKNHEYQATIGFALLLVALLGIWWLRLHFNHAVV
jgi:protein-S-isoprenylcysteine O-methyltransferase Ste14